MIGAFLVFVTLGPLVVGYATGYRFDSSFSLVKTGGIYLHSDEANTRVFIDNEFIEGNGFLLRNTLVQNLKPNRTYNIRVEKDGHFWWEKSLLVRPNLVTEARTLLLPTERVWETIPATTTLEVVPATPGTSSAPTPTQQSTTTASTSIANPQYEALVEFFADDRPQFAIDVATTTLVFDDRLGTSTATTTIITKIQLPEYFNKPDFTFIDFEDKEMLRERNRNAIWLEEGNVYAVWLGDEVATPYYYCSIICTGTIVIDWVDEIHWFDFYPGRDDVVLVVNDNGLHAVELDDRSRQNIQTLREGSGFQARVQNGTDIIIWDTEGEAFFELVE